MRKRLLTGVLALVSLLVGVGVAEVVCRILEGNGGSRKEQPVDDEDPAEGWRGIRRFGDMDSPRPRLLILGDSFTAGRGVAEGEDYGSALGRLGHFEVFSYGAEGYGTAQELLVGRRLLTRVRPAVVLLQMAMNDFVNNSYELESQSLINNNLKMRPYLENGAMVPRYPRVGGRLRASAVDHSALARRLFTGVDRARGWLAVRGFVDTVEDRIAMAQGEDDGFRRSVATTRALLNLLRDEARPVPLLVFPADGVGPQAFLRDELRGVCASLEIPFLYGLPQTIDEANAVDDPVYLPDDPHWSARGHAIAAAALDRWLSTMPIRTSPPKR